MKSISSSLSIYLIRFFYIQLFITLASLPILVNWGLPLSLMSPIANLIFTPFLMFFLLLASLIFFFELISIPNSWLIYSLEKIVYCWSKILSFHSDLWLLSFPKPSIIFFILLLAITFFILHCKKVKMMHAIWFFLLLFCMVIGYLTYQRPAISYIQLPCNRGEITVFKKNNQTVLIDPGALGQNSSTSSWIEYTLVSNLNKTLGSQHIDHVIAMQPSIFTFEALQTLCMQVKIKNLYLVTWEGVGTKKLYRAYDQLKKIMQEKKITMHRIGSWKKTIKLGDEFLEIIPLEQKLPYHEIMFQALQIKTALNKQEINVYSAKLKKIRGENHAR